MWYSRVVADLSAIPDFISHYEQELLSAKKECQVGGLVEKNITLYSTCEHHLLPIIGRAHVAYISNGRVIGLSKMNRIVEYYAKRPQVQERLTIQVADELKEVLQTEHVAVVMDAKHLCVASRGIKDISSATVTASYHGKFNEMETRKNEFT